MISNLENFDQFKSNPISSEEYAKNLEMIKS